MSGLVPYLEPMYHIWFVRSSIDRISISSSSSRDRADKRLGAWHAFYQLLGVVAKHRSRDAIFSAGDLEQLFNHT